jgi:lipopolysaccharide biosynthesis regulator YciM
VIKVLGQQESYNIIILNLLISTFVICFFQSNLSNVTATTAIAEVTKKKQTKDKLKKEVIWKGITRKDTESICYELILDKIYPYFLEQIENREKTEFLSGCKVCNKSLRRFKMICANREKKLIKSTSVNLKKFTIQAEPSTEVLYKFVKFLHNIDADEGRVQEKAKFVSFLLSCLKYSNTFNSKINSNFEILLAFGEAASQNIFLKAKKIKPTTQDNSEKIKRLF